jgi:hypothetical protein
MKSMLARLFLLAVLPVCLLLPNAQAAESGEWLYTVRPGDNIWNLTEKYLDGMRYWRRLQALNEVEDPHRLPPGTRLRIPIAWLKVQPAPVKVVVLQGMVSARRLVRGPDAEPVAKGDLLRSGDTLITGADSNAVLMFADGSQLFVREGSEVTFDRLTAYGDSGMVDTRVRLQRGRVDTRVTPTQGPGTHYQIETPAAVSAVRGTDYRVSIDPQDEAVSRTEVIGGQVAVIGGGITRTLPMNTGTVSKVGEAPKPPKPLLPPADLSPVAPVQDRMPLAVQWVAVPGAQRYRTQVSQSADFDTLLMDRTVSPPQVSGPDLMDGVYYLRVRGIDGDALEGQDSLLRFEVDARPFPPLQMSPQLDETVRVEQPEFTWSEPEDAAAYHLQVARDEGFGDLVVDQPKYDKTTLAADVPLAPGDYYWRVASIAGDGERGPFSDGQKLTVRPAPDSPEVEAPDVGETDLVFRWREGLPGQRFHFQLARDSGFDNVVTDTELTEPTITLPRPEAGTYYLRVSTIDVDGYRGPFGPAQKVSVPIDNWWPPALLAIFGLLML